MWVRKRIDIGYSDILWGLFQACLPGSSNRIQGRVERRWLDKTRETGGAGQTGAALACLSVRSGFDLLLDCAKFPPGSEVLISALTIKDMVRIVQKHNLVAVPVDINLDRLAPDENALRRAITPKTKAIVITHLFGGRVDVAPLLNVAREHNLLVIEDCAQAYIGDGYLGHPQSDVTMFSFGTIKTATALGGAVFGVRDESLLRPMQSKQAAYSAQTRSSYVFRSIKYAGVKMLCTRPMLRLFAVGVEAFGLDFDRLANSAVRGFAGPRFFPRIRRRPSAPLLAVLERRLRRFDDRRLARRTDRGRQLARLLGRDVTLPGTDMLGHTYWVFPILTPRPQEVLDRLQQAGFDATQGASVWVVDPPEDRPELEPHNARRFVRDAVFLPCYPQMPEKTLREMAQCLVEYCRGANQTLAGEPEPQALEPETPGGNETIGLW